MNVCRVVYNKAYVFMYPRYSSSKSLTTRFGFFGAVVYKVFIIPFDTDKVEPRTDGLQSIKFVAKMHISPDFVVTVIFGVIMIIIGLAAIWIVHWQTGVLMREQRRKFLSSLREELPTFANFSVSAGDIERAEDAATPARSDSELSDLSTAVTLRGHDIPGTSPVPAKAEVPAKFANQTVSVHS